tara:strand:+ start:810 stop:1940 length:1131 start_codon:yes stop_codon:yes gene_type:complete
MEKIIFRKFLYDLLVFFLIVSLSLSLITWIIQSVNYLDFISNDGHGFSVYFSYIALNFPKIFSKLVIFSYFISLLFIIEKYQSNYEIYIYWTNGISKIKFANFILKISVVLIILQIILVYFVVPKTQNLSRDFLRNSNIDLFTSLITEKKFIDTVKDLTIFVDEIDDQGNMKNIFLKDGINKENVQIISAKKGRIFEKGENKFLKLDYGQILDVTNNKYADSKVIRFNNTTLNLSNFKTKSTLFPKIQELDSNILILCIENYLFGDKKGYVLSYFECSKETSIKSVKEIFNRSLKQFYILALGIISAILLFFDVKNRHYSSYRLLIFLLGFFTVITSELNTEFLNFSSYKYIMFFLPIFLFVIVYLFMINLNKKTN